MHFKSLRTGSYIASTMGSIKISAKSKSWKFDTTQTMYINSLIMNIKIC